MLLAYLEGEFYISFSYTKTHSLYGLQYLNKATFFLANLTMTLHQPEFLGFCFISYHNLIKKQKLNLEK